MNATKQGTTKNETKRKKEKKIVVPMPRFSPSFIRAEIQEGGTGRDETN
jgi:hypothetical protein